MSSSNLQTCKWCPELSFSPFGIHLRWSVGDISITGLCEHETRRHTDTAFTKHHLCSRDWSIAVHLLIRPVGNWVLLCWRRLMIWLELCSFSCHCCYIFSCNHFIISCCKKSRIVQHSGIGVIRLSQGGLFDLSCRHQCSIGQRPLFYPVLSWAATPSSTSCP